MNRTRILRTLSLAVVVATQWNPKPATADDGDQIVEGYVSWMRPGALYIEGRGELPWGDAPTRWRSATTTMTRCYEVQRSIEIACAPLATVGFIHRARLVLAADGWVRRIDVLDMRQ